MDPKIRVLQKYGTAIVYNEFLPPAFGLDGDRNALTPIIHEAKIP